MRRIMLALLVAIALCAASLAVAYADCECYLNMYSNPQQTIFWYEWDCVDRSGAPANEVGVSNVWH
jgi:hypothetical protein